MIKKTRTRLTLREKLDAIVMMDNGANNRSIALKYRISDRSISKLKKEVHVPKDIAKGAKYGLGIKSMRSILYSLIDKHVQEFCVLSRYLKFPVTQDIIRERALMFCDSLLWGSNLNKK